MVHLAPFPPAWKEREMGFRPLTPMDFPVFSDPVLSDGTGNKKLGLEKGRGVLIIGVGKGTTRAPLCLLGTPVPEP